MSNVGDFQPSEGQQIARAGRHMAVATGVSRLTGVIRTLAFAAVLGTAAVGDAYNGANSFPNMVYELLLGGLLSSVFIPMLVQARLRGRQYSQAFSQRLLAGATLATGFVTVIAVAAAPVLAGLMVVDYEQRQLTTALAYLLLPQIFFYALAALVTSVLNVRESFAPAAWAPVVSNVIMIGTAAVFVVLPGPVTLLPGSMTPAQVLVLGLGTTAGVLGQALWVVVALRRSGFRWSWRVRILPYTWKPVRVGLPMIGWILAYTAISQIGVAVVLRVAFDHGGVSIYTYADLIFQVPYGILGVSLLTVLMPRIADAVARGDTPAILVNLGRGARYAIVALVPVAVALSVLAPPLAKVIFVGRVDPAGAELIGATAAASAFGLVPFAVVMLQMRVFYSGNDTRTPTIINAAMVVTKVGVVTLAAATMPSSVVIVTLGVASSLSFVVGATLGHLLLRHRYGLLGFRHVAATLRRVAAAALPAGGCSLIAVIVIQEAGSGTRLASLAALGVGTTIGVMAFLLAARVVGISELSNIRMLLRR